MRELFVMKKRQIEILKRKIIVSWLLDEKIILDAEKLYNDNPYHNFLHALSVTNYVLELDKNKFSPIEIRSLLVAWIFHDTGHTWKAMELDEFTSLYNFRTTMDNYPEYIIDDSICRSAIIWTVFKNRVTNKNKYAKILADCDIWNIWEGITEFMYYWTLLALEFDSSIENYFINIEKNYFLYLMNINKNIIITEEVRQILPNSLKTIKEFYNISIDKKLEMFDILKNTDITLEEFREKFFKKAE